MTAQLTIPDYVDSRAKDIMRRVRFLRRFFPRRILAMRFVHFLKFFEFVTSFLNWIFCSFWTEMRTPVSKIPPRLNPILILKIWIGKNCTKEQFSRLIFRLLYVLNGIPTVFSSNVSENFYIFRLKIYDEFLIFFVVIEGLYKNDRQKFHKIRRHKRNKTRGSSKRGPIRRIHI